MGSASDNGGDLPHDGGTPDGLPELPEEWGVIVIPDDLSELADEVRAVRAELRLLNREAGLLAKVRAVPVPLSDLARPASPN